MVGGGGQLSVAVALKGGDAPHNVGVLLTSILLGQVIFSVPKPLHGRNQRQMITVTDP